MKPGLFAIGLLVSATVQAAPARVEVLVVGSYHFGNPGRDVNNIKADSVLTATRQVELARVATAMLAFRPTRVMVENESSAPDLGFAGCAGIPGDLLKEPGEIVQLGCRIAAAANVGIYGIDELPKAGEPDYFPIDKVQAAAARLGQTPIVTVSNVSIAAAAKSLEAAMGGSSIAQLLIRMNTPDTPMTNLESYYGVLGVGDRDEQSGAELNALWYLRNAKIFAKLMSVARPGDRVVVVYGAGHSFWLRHFARHTPGYLSVDPLPYLRRAAAAR